VLEVLLVPHNPFANVDRPLNVGQDWSDVELSDNYVAVMEIRNNQPGSPFEHWYVAVRGGLTTGHWSEREAMHVGARLQAEVSGRCIGTLMVGVWQAWANPVRSAPEPVTVQDCFRLTLDSPDHALGQYKNDPLVTGQELEV
jgi:hypothetical protein